MRKMYMGLLILLLLWTASLISVHYLESQTELLLSFVDKAEDALEKGSNSEACAIIDKAIDHWEGMESYTHIFIRHAETDSTTDAFYELKNELGSADENSVSGVLGKLRSHLSGLVRMEKPSFGSVF